jgi:hypothetical protein
MAVRVYLLNSLVDAKGYPQIAGGHIHMKGHFSIKLNLDPTMGHYLTIDWTLHDYKEKFDLIPDLKEYVVKITLLEEGYFNNAYVDGKYTCKFGLMKIIKFNQSEGRVFMEAESLESFNRLVTAYREGELILESAKETVLRITQNQLRLVEETIKQFEKSFLYKVYILLKNLNPF